MEILITHNNADKKMSKRNVSLNTHLLNVVERGVITDVYAVPVQMENIIKRLCITQVQFRIETERTLVPLVYVLTILVPRLIKSDVYFIEHDFNIVVDDRFKERYY